MFLHIGQLNTSPSSSRCKHCNCKTWPNFKALFSTFSADASWKAPKPARMSEMRSIDDTRVYSDLGRMGGLKVGHRGGDAESKQNSVAKEDSWRLSGQPAVSLYAAETSQDTKPYILSIQSG